MANNDRNAVQSGLSDLLGDVIKGDRKTSGRNRKEIEPIAEPVPANQDQNAMISNDVDVTDEIMTLTHYDVMTELQADKQTDKPSKQIDAPATPRTSAQKRESERCYPSCT